jgi:glucuronosyltransferase
MEEMIANPPSGLNFLKKATQFQNGMLDFVNATIHDPAMKKMMAEEQFDMVILPFFMSEMQIGLAAHFKCPLVVVASMGDTSMVTSLVGNPSAVATSSSIWLGYKQPMTFWQRVLNFLVIMMEGILVTAMRWKNEKYYTSNFPPEKYPPYAEMITKVDLLLANHHFSEGNVRATVPSLVDIGGLQTKEKPDALPAHIQNWIDGAEHGVIFFSLGSNMKSSLLSSDKLKAILNVFGRLKQRVLFKWETDKLPGSPENVMPLKWMPQDDILAHNKVKLFITHGGKGSLVESKFHGVPVIVIPIFADQAMNAAAVVEDGWGLQVDYADLSEEKLGGAITEILGNTK